MADDKVLIIMTSGPDTPRRCATPFFFASPGCGHGVRREHVLHH